MPFYRMRGLMVHVKLSGKRSAWPKPCCARVPANPGPKTVSMRCFAMSTVLCDWPLEGGGTCDAPLCPEHALKIGEDRDLCPLHAPRRAELPGQQELL